MLLASPSTRAPSGSTSRSSSATPASCLCSSPPGVLGYGLHDLQEAGVPARHPHPRLRRQRRDPARTPGTARCSRASSTTRRRRRGCRPSPGSPTSASSLPLFLRPVSQQPAPAPARRRPPPRRRRPSATPTPACARRTSRRRRRPAVALARAAIRRAATPPAPRRPAARSRSRRPTPRATSPRTTANAGNLTFEITNKGTKVTEFYLYAEGDRIMGEVENIAPGLNRRLIVEVADAGKYQTACKPGMAGDGIRGGFTVTGGAPEQGADQQKSQATKSYADYIANKTARCVTGRRQFVGRGQGRQGRRGEGRCTRGPRLLRADRAGGREVRRPGPGHRRAARPTSSRASSSPASTGWRRTCGRRPAGPTAGADRRQAAGRRQGPRRRGRRRCS